jgi:sortase A
VLVAVSYSIISPILPALSLITTRAIPDYNAPEALLAKDIFSDTDVEELVALSDADQKITVDSADIPASGERYGEIICSEADINAALYYGDTMHELGLGVGTYSGDRVAYIPGGGRTILLAGHTNTVFRNLGELIIGDKIQINTSYGRYEYEVDDLRIAKDTDTSAYDFTRTDENLILYTCYPFGYLGLTNQRYFVYAKYVSGPQLDLAF